MKLESAIQNEIKKNLGFNAAKFVQNGMLIGLGTGTTAKYFIEALVDRCKQGLKVRAVSSSEKSLQQAKSGGIPIADMQQVTKIDLTIDGADEIDPQNRMIKGGGGALFREKILASSSDEMIVIVDESKLVAELGAFGVPLEILPFGYKATLAKLEGLGYTGAMRLDNEKKLYITDNGNYIFDIRIPDRFPEPEEDHKKIIEIPGIVETGFFFNLASKVLIGYSDGQVLFRE